MSDGGSHEDDRRMPETAHFERIVEATGDAIYSLDADGRFTYANDAHDALTGYGSEELIGEHVSIVTDERDVERIEGIIRELSTTADRHCEKVEIDLVTRDGERIPTEIHVSLLVDDDGTFRGTTGIVRDISERERRERELQEYEAIVETVPDGVLVIDENGVIVDANRTAAWLYDHECDDLVGQPFDRFVEGDGSEESLDDRYTELLGSLFIAEAIGEQARFEYDATVDGERRVFETNFALRPSDDGEFRGTIGVVRDITERREHERSLERYETIIEASGDPVYALDEAGRFAFVNRAQADIVGYERSELLGEHFSLVADESDVRRGMEVIERLTESEERRHETFEVTLLTRDGERIPVENHVALLTDEDDDVRGTAGIIRDISDRKERERALERHNERLDRVASVLSHDLRNPLNVAVGRVGMARESDDEEHLAKTEDALRRMGDLIDDVLSLAREGKQVVATDVVALGPVVDTAWESVDAASATLDREADLGAVIADESRLQRLLENLLQNAGEHGGAGIRVRVGSMEAGFFVEDDGPGIPPPERDGVFEFGRTTSETGTGFGLAIAKEIAEAHGWTIDATESTAGGARFEVAGVEWNDPA